MPDYLVTLPSGERYKLSMPEEAEGARETAAQRLRAGAVGPGDRPTPEVPQDFQTWGNLAEARSKNFPHFPDDVRQVPDYIRDHPESITDMLGMGGTLKLVQSGPTKLIKIFGEHGVTKHTFDIMDEATGKKVGFTKVTYNPQKKNITVDYIESEKPRETERRGSMGYAINQEANSLGPREIRTLLPAAKEAFPSAESVSGFRVTGARQATGELGGMTLPLPGSKVKPEAEPRPQIDPEIAGSYLDQWSRAAPAEPAPRYTNEDIDRLSGYLDSLSGPRSLR